MSIFDTRITCLIFDKYSSGVFIVLGFNASMRGLKLTTEILLYNLAGLACADCLVVCGNGFEQLKSFRN